MINPFEEPKFTFKDVEFKDLNFRGVDLNFKIIVDNPNFVGLTINSFYYQLKIDGEKIADGHEAGITEIKGKDISEITIPITVDFSGLSDSIVTVFQKNELEYELTGYLIVDSPVGNLKFNFEDYEFYQGTIPIPKIPKIHLQTLNIKEFGVTNIDLELVIDLNNSNDFSFQLKELRYMFLLNQSTVSKAAIKSNNMLLPGEAVEVKIPINLKLANLHKGIINALRQRRIKYKLFVNLIIDSSRGEIKLPLKEEGDIDLIKK
jgi:LEA14-like dessication related protein